MKKKTALEGSNSSAQKSGSSHQSENACIAPLVLKAVAV